VSYRFESGLELALLAHFVDEWENPNEDLYDVDDDTHKLNLLFGISVGWGWN